MTERLLQFIWQFQYFNKSGLTTSADESLEIIEPGIYNTHQGPDFSEARIRIGSTVWAGAVELHLKTSDWEKHHHQFDKNYNNVILHVVWENDETLNPIPVLELNDRVSNILLERYESLMNNPSFIPCENNCNSVNELTWNSWKERLLVERLSRKGRNVKESLKQNNTHWEETLWWMLARNFGIPVNADAFESIARSLALKIITKHMNQIHQLESLLLGQAGLLSQTFNEDYPRLLQREYEFLRGKYKLIPIHQPVHFLRMRPAGFPTIRLAQLAKLLHTTNHLFDKIRDINEAKDIRNCFDLSANDYWNYHYRLDEPSAYREKNLGSSMIDSILINTITPVLFAYGDYYNENKFKEKALRWLEETGAELNSITRGFELLGVPNKTAFDSQALVELKKQYCDERRCLECAIGNAVLKLDVDMK